MKKNRFLFYCVSILLVFVCTGCGKNLTKVKEYIDQHLTAFKTTDENMDKVIENERKGRAALLKISKKTPAQKSEINKKAELLIDEVRKGRKIELNALKGLKSVVKALSD